MAYDSRKKEAPSRRRGRLVDGSGACASLGRQRLEIDRSAHRLISGGIGMKVIALVEFRQGVAGLLQIDDDLVEVDDAVKGAAPDEVVQRETDLLFVRRVIALERRSRESVAKGREGRADNLKPMRMRARSAACSLR
jgi:hypothetical protein